jgi:hypothetical protein
MIKIDVIENDLNQKIIPVQSNNETFDFALRYDASSQKWYYSIEKDDLIINNTAFVLHPNILRQFKNIINFGLAVIAIDGVDPAFENDFIERVSVYILDSDEVEEVEERYFNK